MQMTTEWCPECESETEIESGKVGICEYCGTELFPCADCVDNYGKGICSWDDKTKSCKNFKHGVGFK